MLGLKNIWVLTLCLLAWVNAFGQYNMASSKSRKIKFKLINNVIIIPVELNGLELSFVLDTGVTKTILFNLAEVDSTANNRVETRYIKGLGGGSSVKSLISKGNILKIGDVTKVNQSIFMVYDTYLNFTPRLGVPIHGIIGYDLFKDFVVELNYSSKYVKLHKHASFNTSKLKNWTAVPIDVIKKKPFLDAVVTIENRATPVKLLMDTGGSDALWLFRSSDETIKPRNDLHFDDFLGYGLSGSVYGKRSKANKLSINGFEHFNVNVAFPDSIYLSQSSMYKERNGSISGNLLKRFNYYLNYKEEVIYIKRNKLYKEPFFYNNSGIVVEQRGNRVVKQLENLSTGDLYNRRNIDGKKQLTTATTYRYLIKPAFQIVEIRDQSNAQMAGLKLGDIIVSVNNKATSNLSLQELNQFFYDRPGKILRLEVKRNEELLNFRFELDNVFKKKDPQVIKGL